VLKLITQHPDATRDELEAMYLAKAKKKEALIDEALRRAFDNDLARVHIKFDFPKWRAGAPAVHCLVAQPRA
jgi:hypothetical protein